MNLFSKLFTSQPKEQLDPMKPQVHEHQKKQYEKRE